MMPEVQLSIFLCVYLLFRLLTMQGQVCFLTCLLNQNDVFRKCQKVRPIFFNSGQLTSSGDMCPQIKSIYFLVLLSQKVPKMGQKVHKWGEKVLVWYGMD